MIALFLQWNKKYFQNFRFFFKLHILDIFSDFRLCGVFFLYFFEVYMDFFGFSENFHIYIFVALWDPESTKFQCYLGPSPRDWRTLIHFNVVLTVFHMDRISQGVCKTVRTTFQCNSIPNHRLIKISWAEKGAMFS